MSKVFICSACGLRDREVQQAVICPRCGAGPKQLGHYHSEDAEDKIEILAPIGRENSNLLRGQDPVIVAAAFIGEFPDVAAEVVRQMNDV
jgi:hypothetical protein